MLEKLVMALLLLITIAAFAKRSRDLVGYLKLGRPDDRFGGNWGRRIKDEAVVVFGQRKLLQWTIPGLMHFFIFWGFLVLFTTIVEAFGAIFERGFHLPLIGRWGPLGALQDFFIVAVLLGILAAFAIRKLQRPGRFTGSHLREADYILVAIGAIMVTILFSRATQIALGRFPYDTTWTPVSYSVSKLFEGMSLSARERDRHDLSLVAFADHPRLPRLHHLFEAPAHRHFLCQRALPIRPAQGRSEADAHRHRDDVRRRRAGAGKVTDLTWKQLLDTYTCTECGRCQSQCPAWNTGKPLSPKLLIMDLRDHLFEHGPQLAAAKQEGDAAFAAAVAELPPLNPDVVEDEVIWDCTTCGACVQACPVDIEHIDTIIDMRRNLVMSEARIPKEMQGALQSLETTGNPWGQPPQARVEWTQGSSRQEPLRVPHISAAPDAEVLLWVGCAGAYDDRNKKVVYDFARLMQMAGVKFATLGPDENCNGDPARRMGAEYVYQMLAEQAIGQLNENRVKKIVTICPHCFNTMFNEYPQFGGNFEVVHHTEFLAQLVKEGRLQPAGEVAERITYHDPCYLARHNDVWKGARRHRGDPRDGVRRATPS